MMHKAWSSIEKVPYCFSRSSVKFQGHTSLKIVEFDPNWAFPDCNSSLNSPMAMKCYTKLETAKERCPIVFQGHPPNFKVTRVKTLPILTQIGRFRTIGRSQLSNPSDLPCWFLHEAITAFGYSHCLRLSVCQPWACPHDKLLPTLDEQRCAWLCVGAHLPMPQIFKTPLSAPQCTSSLIQIFGCREVHTSQHLLDWLHSQATACQTYQKHTCMT